MRPIHSSASLRARPPSRARRGLTLIEVVVVVTILALLMAAVGVYALGQYVHSQRQISTVEVRSVLEAADLFKASHGRYPSTAEGIEALVRAKALKRAPKDAWGHPLAYALEDGEPAVTSFGADGAPGGQGDDADISSRELE